MMERKAAYGYTISYNGSSCISCAPEYPGLTLAKAADRIETIALSEIMPGSGAVWSILDKDSWTVRHGRISMGPDPERKITMTGDSLRIPKLV